jgi:hypothetical protein
MMRRQRLRNTELSVRNNTYVDIPMSGAVSRGRSVGVACAKLIQIIKARRTAGHDGMANWNGRATDAELSRLFYE